MGGKSAKPTVPSYEPYQCCPAKPNQATRVAKVSRVTASQKGATGGGKLSNSGVTSKLSTSKSNLGKASSAKTTSSSSNLVPALKPINKLTAKDSKKIASVVDTNGVGGKTVGNKANTNTANKANNNPVKSSKGKKGFFGSVVAGIPYLMKV
ncbi:uncharacterized protein [Venturia canescens]|nr:uncharacterized protein LOC122408956 isoform X2 [Venturia canescens]XP_043272034.1 uncharacterized protein LOC122408956 isoform X2 [Venturia canescens]